MLLAETDSILNVIKDAGFSQWLFYGVCALLIWERVEKARNRDKARDVRVVSGEVDVGEKRVPADKSEVEEELEKLRREIHDLGEENEAEHKASRTAGETRVTNITHFVETENTALKHIINELSHKVEAHTAALHEKINALAVKVAEQGADIKNIDKENFREWSRRQTGK